MNLIKTIFLFFLGFLPLVVTAQTKAETLATIDRMRNDKQFNDALVLTERMLDKKPDDLDLLVLKAFLTDEKGDRVGAYRELFQLREAYPDNDTVISSIAYFDLYSGRLDSAAANYQRCLQLADDRLDSFSALINLGSVYMSQQEFIKAIAYHQDLLIKFPDSTVVLINLGQAYARNGQEHESVTIYEQLSKMLPGDKMVYNNLGMLYTQMGKYADAVKALEHGLAIEPKDAYLLNNCGYAVFKTKDYAKALKLINESIAENNTNPYAYRNRALVYLGLKLNREACNDLAASSELGFKMYYGDEVGELQKKYCK